MIEYQACETACEKVKVLVANLKRQKSMYSRLLQFSGKQLELFKNAGGDLDLEALSRLMAEQQNLIEHINDLTGSVGGLREGIARSCGLTAFSVSQLRERLPQAAGDQLGKVVADLHEVIRSLDEQDKECRSHAQSMLDGVAAKLKSVSAGNKAVKAYQKRGGYSAHGVTQEGRFIDHKK